MTQHVLRSANQIPPHPVRAPRPESDTVFGTLLFEVTVASDTLPTVPTAVPGWTLRLWPQARLGDATLEARADDPEDIPALLNGLAEVGIGLLGPVRRRQG